MKKILILLTVFSALGCSRVKDKAKDAIHGFGETVGESSSEFVDGVSEGIDKKYKCHFVINDSSKYDGIEVGQYDFHSTDTSNENILSIYIVFNKTLDTTANILVQDNKGREYGRTTARLKSESNQGKFVDVVFDKRTDLERMSTFIFQ